MSSTVFNQELKGSVDFGTQLLSDPLIISQVISSPTTEL